MALRDQAMLFYHQRKIFLKRYVMKQMLHFCAPWDVHMHSCDSRVKTLCFAALSAVTWCYNNPFCVPTSMKWTFVNLEHTLLCSIIQRSTCPSWKSTSWSCRKWEKNSASMRVIVGHLKCKVSSIICWLFVSLLWSFSRLWKSCWGEM